MSSDSDVTPKKQRSRSTSLPRGKYTLVGIDIDTTGRRLIDEIVQLSAHAHNSSYSQYIMPYMNLNPAARQRHQVRVITIGFFRMLKSMQTYKVVKTKSEIAALLEFLDWLEKLKKSDPNSNGVILIYHEQRKFIPYMLLEAFKKYELLSRFLSVVRSFSNGYDFATTKCANTVKYLNLRQLSKVLFNHDDEKTKTLFEGNASVRARLAFEIAQHLARGDLTDLSPDKEMENMSNVLYDHSHPVSHEIAELKNQRKILERQNSLRPIFLQYFRTTLYHRVKAVTFRRVLAESDHDYESLKALWTEKKKEGVLAVIDPLEELKPEEKIELIDLIDSYFDPQKSPMKPVVKPRSRSRRNSSRYGRNKENVKPRTASGSGQSPAPEASVRNSPAKNKTVKNENNNDVLVAEQTQIPQQQQQQPEQPQQPQPQAQQQIQQPISAN